MVQDKLEGLVNLHRVRCEAVGIHQITLNYLCEAREMAINYSDVIASKSARDNFDMLCTEVGWLLEVVDNKKAPTDAQTLFSLYTMLTEIVGGINAELEKMNPENMWEAVTEHVVENPLVIEAEEKITEIEEPISDNYITEYTFRPPVEEAIEPVAEEHTIEPVVEEVKVVEPPKPEPKKRDKPKGGKKR